MTQKLNCLVWLDSGSYAYMHLGIVRSLSSFNKMDFYGIVGSIDDYNFVNYKNTLFKEIIYFPEYYIDKQDYDLNYLKKIEKEYDLNLWLLIYGERFFHKYRNNFYNFSRDEILSIIFHSIQFFIQYIEKLKPDILIMQTAGENILNFLLYKIAKKIGIKIMMLNTLHIHNKFVISNNLIGREISDEYIRIIRDYENSDYIYDEHFIKNKSLHESVKIQSDFIFNNSNYLKKIKHYFKRIYNEPEPIYQNYGKSKSKMFKSKYEFKNLTKKREKFLFKKCINQIEDENFFYMPLHTEPEAKILATAPFFSDQISLVENVARSIPVDQILYVKEHPGQKLKFWRSIQDYERILKLQNVKLINPNFKSQTLISKSTAVISIMGSTGFEALFFKKPVFLFSDEYYDVSSMVKRITDISQMPEIIKNHLTNFKFNNLELNALMDATNSCSICIPYFSIMKDAIEISSINKNYKIETSIDKFDKFFSIHEKSFQLIANSIISKSKIIE